MRKCHWFVLPVCFLFLTFSSNLGAQDVQQKKDEAPRSGEPATEVSAEDWANDDWGDDDSFADDDWEGNGRLDNIPPENIYSLERLIELGLSNNPGIKAANWELAYTHELAGEAWWAWFPQIRLRSAITLAPDYNPPSTQDPDAFISYDPEQWSVGGVVWGNDLEVNIPLYTFGKINNLRKQGPLAEQAGRYGRKQAECRLTYEVKRIYYSLQLIERTLKVLEEAQDYLNKAEDKLEELLETGADTVSMIDRYKFEVVKADLASRFAETERNRKVLMRTLHEVLALSPDAPLYLDHRYLQRPERKESLLDRSDVQNQMLTQRPEIRLLNLKVERNRLESKRQFAYYFPDFFVSMKYRFVYTPSIDDVENPFLNDPYNENYLTGFVGLQYTFDLPLQIHRSRQAEAKFNKSEQERKHYQSMMTIELEEGYQAYHEKLKQMEISKKSEGSGRKWMVSEWMNYNAGFASSSDLVEGIAAYIKTQFQYHASMHAVFLAQAKLEWLMANDSKDLNSSND